MQEVLDLDQKRETEIMIVCEKESVKEGVGDRGRNRDHRSLIIAASTIITRAKSSRSKKRDRNKDSV